MEPAIAGSHVYRLEDIITLVQEGIETEVEVALRKERFSQKVHREETEEMRDELDLFLFVADYTVKYDDHTDSVSKVYMYTSAEQHSLDAIRTERHIANERLKADYKRLKEANITIDEIYFQGSAFSG